MGDPDATVLRISARDKRGIKLFPRSPQVADVSLTASRRAATLSISLNDQSTRWGRTSGHSLSGTMTRYTNVGWKRTYHQAGFDPNDDQIAQSTPSTPVHVPSSSDAAAQFESIIDTPAESNLKRRRKSNAESERKVAADSAPAAIASDEDKMSSSVAEKKRTKALAGRPKPKTKAKTRRAKSA